MNVCPSCQSAQRFRMSYGSWICDACDRAFTTDYVDTWNQGFKVGLMVVRLPEHLAPEKEIPNHPHDTEGSQNYGGG